MVKKLITRRGRRVSRLDGRRRQVLCSDGGSPFHWYNTNSIAYQRTGRERLDRASGCGTGSVKCHIRRVVWAAAMALLNLRCRCGSVKHSLDLQGSRYIAFTFLCTRCGVVAHRLEYTYPKSECFGLSSSCLQLFGACQGTMIGPEHQC